MNVNGQHYRTIWVKPENPEVIQIIDQTALPHSFAIVDLVSVEDFCTAIRDMLVRGAGLIGATAAYGMYAAVLHAPGSRFDEHLTASAEKLLATRPTAKNLEWAVGRQLQALSDKRGTEERRETAFRTAREIADFDADCCERIGKHGYGLIEAIWRKKKGKPVNILTHCNAGWLAFVDFGSATAPIYESFDRGIDLHVWVDETRPRNQGAALTAWELGSHGVPHTLIADNTGGHLMQHGMVDMVVVGTDRTSRTGDVANKIGTYLKALAAKDNDVPFYVALPSSTFDWSIRDGLAEIPIEERNQDEVRYVGGQCGDGPASVLICPRGTKARNYAFDVTPARLVSGLITERGVCTASESGILSLFPESACVGEQG